MTCIDCIDNCLYCSDGLSCDTCDEGYSFVDSTCTQCDLACDGCSGEGPSDCNVCSTNYYEFEGVCQSTCPEYYFANDNTLTC